MLPLLRSRPALLALLYVELSGLPQTHIVDPASITNRLHLSVLISRPSSKDLAFPAEDRDAEERRQYTRIIARNDLLFSRPIKSAICWQSERDREQEKESGLVNAEITGSFRVVAILAPHAARLTINPRKFAPY